MEAKTPIFTTAAEILATATTESYVVVAPGHSGPAGRLQDNIRFSPLAPTFRPRNESLMAHLEPRAGDIAPVTLQIDDEMLTNFRIGGSGSDILFEDVEHNGSFFTGLRSESVTSNMWGESSGTSSSSPNRNDDMMTFDFLAKSISSANSYVASLNREQLSVLQAFNPSLLFEFLQEVAKVRNDKRLRRAAPNECAFCKNNGENEECYSSHALKDWRGRVLCPVLRAFKCPRCGASGDRAHTIKYCPETPDNGLDRSGSFARRRMGSSSSLMFGPLQHQPAPTPSPVPAPQSFNQNSIWNHFSTH